LDYTPAKVARALRKRRTEAIAILVPDISNPFFSLLARGAAAVAYRSGLSTLICDSNNSTETEDLHWETLLAEEVEGVVFVPAGRPNAGKLQRVLRRGIRVVAADRVVEGLPGVRADNRRGSAELTAYLLELGYRRFAYITGPEEVGTVRERLRGFQEALEQEGIEPLAVRHGEFTYEDGYALAAEILSSVEGVEIIVAGNDLMAIGARRAAEDRGLAVPRDLGITGFDNVLFAGLVRPRLTTVEIPAFALGKAAMELLLEGEREGIRTLPTRLIPGASTAPKGR